MEAELRKATTCEEEGRCWALLLPFSGSRPRLLLPSRSPWSGSGGRERGEEGEEEVLKVEGARRP